MGNSLRQGSGKDRAQGSGNRVKIIRRPEPYLFRFPAISPCLKPKAVHYYPGETMNLGMPEILIILLVALLLFGPRKLPELGRSLGQSIREFQRGAKNIREEFEKAAEVKEFKEIKEELSKPLETKEEKS
jgi:sec-independent protein translocase protein TatA